MFRALVTDANYKQAVALARHAKRAIPDLRIVGHDPVHGVFAGSHCCDDSILTRMPVTSALRAGSFDMVIPVGATSVLTVAAECPKLAVLPPREELEVSYDKRRTVDLANKLKVPAPQTTNLGESLRGDVIKSFRLASKGARELLPSSASRDLSSWPERAEGVRRAQASPVSSAPDFNE